MSVREQKIEMMPDMRQELHTQRLTGPQFGLSGGFHTTIKNEVVRAVDTAFSLGRGIAIRLRLAAYVDRSGEPVIVANYRDVSEPEARLRLDLDRYELDVRRQAMEPAEQRERWVDAMAEWYQ